MNKNYRLIDEIYQQANSMFKNILISIILYNFATDWIHLLGRDIFEMSFISTHIYRGVEKMYVTFI